MELPELVHYVRRTYVIDESGNANLLEFLLDPSAAEYLTTKTPLEEVLVGFLHWANGPKWKEFLDNAEVGDRP